MAPSNLSKWWKLQDRGWRLFLGISSVFFLALFLHFRDVRLEVLELNTTANRYLVAQVDFKFPDYEATILAKQQALQEIGEIEQIDPKQLQQVKSSFEQRLITSKKWRSDQISYEEMHRAIALFAQEVGLLRFTDARTIQLMKDLPIPEIFFCEKNPEEGDKPPFEAWSYPLFSEIDGDENLLAMGSVIKSSAGLSEEGFLSFLLNIAKNLEEKEEIHPRVTERVLQFFQEPVWNFKKDTALERKVRSEVSKTIPEKYSYVHAGERLIEPGEKITSRHLTMMQAMKQEISDRRKLWEPMPIIASFILSFIFISVSTLYFFYYQQRFLRSLQQISLFVCILFMTLLLAKGTEFLLLKSGSSVLERINYPIIAPFATLLLCVLISPRIALFGAVFISIILSVSLAVDHGRFLILNLVTSLIVIICTRFLRKRKEVFSIFAKTALSSIPIFYVFTLSENQLWNSSLFIDVFSTFAFLMICAILVVGLLPVLESLFRILTDMTLMEYMDSSNELLQKLALEVPGTYQHSLVLAHLAETCAAEIGANGLFCRAAALYHDIGKMMNPQFYTENQSLTMNLHQLLTPVESAQVIISHVIDGVQLARKHRLPQAFIDVIYQHHGTSLVYYFYANQLQLKEGRKEEVDETLFRYPGPKPQTKESAILMICDTVEAASRSLDEVSEASVVEMVERLVNEKTEEGQLEECNLTFEELTRIKRKLIKALFATQHVRVKYPKKV